MTPPRRVYSAPRGASARPASAERFEHRRRLLGVVVLFVLVAGLLSLRLLQLQMFDRDRYVAWGRDQRLQTIPLEGQRGRLLDRNGEALAVSLPQPYVAADPGLVDDAAQAAATLAPLLGIDAAKLEFELLRPTRFVYLKRMADDKVADELRALQLPYLIVRDEPRRFHPDGEELARGVLGAVGVDNVGLSGLELQFDDLLRGTAGQLVVEQSIDGRTIPDGVREVEPAQQGKDVTLTIERALQFQAEQALADAVERTNARGGIVVICEPATGDILAMASVSASDEGGVATTPSSPALTQMYEPGSVMKAMTFAAVLDHGLGLPTTSRLVPDEYPIYEDVFSDDESHDPELMSMRDILMKSSNVGTILWADDLGDSVLHDYLVDFGFGHRTALDFPNEASGILDDVKDWSGTSFATIAIGQGIAVTPMQMLKAYNVIANNGIDVAPRLVAPGTIEPSGAETVVEVAARRVVSAEAASQVADMLVGVVDSGTATAAAVPGYRIAAKTGTARKVQDGGGYVDADGHYHYVATVAGFFPADAPRFSMIVVLDEPDGSYASRTSAPLFGELAAWTLRHFQVSPGTDLVFDRPEQQALGVTGEAADAPR